RGGHPDVPPRPVGQPDMDPLQVRLEHAAAHAGALGADSAQVLGLATARDVVAKGCLLTADFTPASHRTDSSASRRNRCVSGWFVLGAMTDGRWPMAE